MEITAGEFDVPKAEQEELLSLLGPMRDEIVEVGFGRARFTCSHLRAARGVREGACILSPVLAHREEPPPPHRG